MLICESFTTPVHSGITQTPRRARTLTTLTNPQTCPNHTHPTSPRCARTHLTTPTQRTDVSIHSPHSPKPQMWPYAHHRTHPTPRRAHAHTTLTQAPNVAVRTSPPSPNPQTCPYTGPSMVPAHHPNPQMCPHTLHLRLVCAHSPNPRRPADTTPQPPRHTHTHLSCPQLLRAQPLLSSENSSPSPVPLHHAWRWW